MSLPAQKMREMTLQMLYGQALDGPPSPEIVGMMMHELAVSKKNVRLALAKVQQIQELLPQIDPLIASASLSYTFERIQKVTLAILRLGVYELLFEQQIPQKVAIAEAIRLSRKFNTRESAAFVNALLDALYQMSLGAALPKNYGEEEAKQLLASEEIEEEIAALESIQEEEPENGDEPSF